MTRQNSSKGRIARPPGVTPVLKERSRARRDEQKLLAATRLSSPSSRLRNDHNLGLQIRYVPTHSLKPANRRIRKADRAQAGRLDASLAEFGICLPLLVDSEHRIVHGHGIWEAAGRAGLETIPVIEIAHLSSEKRRLLAIALNRLAETATWDEQVLAEELEELLASDEEVLVTAFTLAEIDGLIQGEAEDAEEPEDLPSLPPEPVSQPGDLWHLGDQLLLQGDALLGSNYEQLLGQEQAQLILTDVPYNVPNVGFTTSKAHHREFAMAHGELSREEFIVFNQRWIRNAASVLIDGGLLGTFIDWRSVEIILAVGRELGLDLLNTVVWQKTNGGQGSLWRSQHELLPVFKTGSAPHINNVQLGRFGRYRTNVWCYPGGSSLGSEVRAEADAHPTIKPRAMLEDALLDVTNRFDIVVDPFLGSGSTLLAAETTGRRCRAIEIDGRYCDVAIARWQRLTGQEAVLAETGESFAAVSHRRSSVAQPREDVDAR